MLNFTRSDLATDNKEEYSAILAGKDAAIAKKDTKIAALEAELAALKNT